MPGPEKRFSDYKLEGHLWITLSTGEYYPDILALACELYKPVLVLFGQMLAEAHSSTNLFLSIAAVKESWMRVQLSRVFRKYVSPETPVEMLRRKSAAQAICERFGKGFRDITEIQERFTTRPLPDEALCALLWEYKDRGKKGYDLTERLFIILREVFPTLTVTGPERAGKDVLLGTIFADYPKPNRPVDFVILEGTEPLAIGLARYDSDRGERKRTIELGDIGIAPMRFSPMRTRTDSRLRLSFSTMGLACFWVQCGMITLVLRNNGPDRSRS